MVDENENDQTYVRLKNGRAKSEMLIVDFLICETFIHDKKG